MIGNSIGVQFRNYIGGGVPIDAQAQVHYNRVIADGGVVPSGLSGVNAFFSAVKAIYGTSDINTAISAAYDAHYLGYKLGAGSGTTLGQAAQKMYAPKGIFGGIGTGSAFWQTPSTLNNFISTPSAIANELATNFSLRVEAVVNSDGIFICKDNVLAGSGRQFRFSISTGIISLIIYDTSDNTFTYNSTTTVPFSLGSYHRVGVSRNSSTGEVKFFTSLDGITWTQLGSTVSGITGTLNNPNQQIQIGLARNSTGVINANFYRIEIYKNDTFTTPTQIFNANQYTGANTWTSTTSEVWTVNSTGAGLADVVQTTAASQPLLLEHSGANYWWGSGVAGNYVSTPQAAANQITGDIDIRAYINPNSTKDLKCIVGSGTSGQPNYRLEVMSNRTMRFASFGGFGAFAISSALSSSNQWVRVVKNTSTNQVIYYTSNDAPTTNINSITWTQLGSAIAYTTTPALVNSELWIGNYPGYPNDNQYQNGIYRATISNSIGGTPIVDFNPASYNPSVSQTQWSSATGEVWTINTSLGTGTGYRGLLVDRSYVMSDGIDDAMVNTFTLATIKTIYNTYKIWDATATGSLFASNNGAEVVDANLTGTGNCLQYDNAVNQITISLTGTGNRYTMRTAVINGANSLQQINNGTAATGTLGTSNSTSMKIFQERNGSFKSKMVFSGMFLSLSADNTTIKTAMYNYLRSINGNSF
jgi:hypothetical protein